MMLVGLYSCRTKQFVAKRHRLVIGDLVRPLVWPISLVRPLVWPISLVSPLVWPISLVSPLVWATVLVRPLVWALLFGQQSLSGHLFVFLGRLLVWPVFLVR